jgi:hypothetical protein
MRFCMFDKSRECDPDCVGFKMTMKQFLCLRANVTLSVSENEFQQITNHPSFIFPDDYLQ